MTKTYAIELHTKHCNVGFNHELLQTLRSRNLAVDVEELWSVGTIKHGSDNSGYLAAIVSHLQAPIEEVDVVDQERVETHICGCPDFYFDCYDNQIGAKIDDCKHTERIKKKRHVETDEQHDTLIP